MQKPPLVYVEYFHGGSTSNYGDFTNHGGETRQEMQSIFLDGYKGVRHNIASHTTNFEIYDVASDHSEGNDLAGTSPFFIDLQQRMKDTVLRIRRVDGSAARPYDNELVPAVDAVVVEPGLDYAQFEGLWPWLPIFENLSPVGAGPASNIDATTHLSRSDDAGLLYTGFLSIRAGGSWTFHARSDAGVHLRIHGSQVIDADFGYGESEVSGNILLQAGLHPFRLYYRSRLEEPMLSLSWSGPGVPKERVPESAFFRRGTPPPEPVAENDFASTTGGPVIIPVLNNDRDDGAPEALTIASIGPPAGGTAIEVAGEIRYVPFPGFFGQDEFSYSITDGEFEVSALVSVTVIYQAADLWIPLNECGGGEVFEAGGTLLGTMSGFGDAAPIGGVHGKALRFDGVGDQVDLHGIPAASLPVGAAARTVMCSVRAQPGVAFENQTMFGYGLNSNGQRFTFLLNGSSGDPNNQELRLEVQGGSIRGTTPLDDGAWHHVAAVCDDFNGDGSMNVDETRLYVDGNLEAISGSAARVVNTAAGTTPRLGGSNHASNYNFAGELDDLRLFPEPLTQSEVQMQMRARNQEALAWHRRNFGSGAIDWSTDGDGDGLNRFGEYAFSGNPHLPDSAATAPVTAYNLSTDKLKVTFRRRVAGSHNLVYQVEASDNLLDWDPLAASEITSRPLALPDCLEEASFESVAGADLLDRQFLRVVVRPLP